MIKNLFFLTLILTACTTAPKESTKVYEKEQLSEVKAQSVVPSQIQMLPDTIIFDTRPMFDYSASHLQGAIHLTSDEFYEAKTPLKGVLKKDLFGAARRLARLGVGPESHVLILGKGNLGDGEEGRLAWFFNYLGIKNVQIAKEESLKLPREVAESKPHGEVPIWKPQIVESLQINLKAFHQEVEDPLGDENSTEAPAILLDVRSKDEYLSKDLNGLPRKTPSFGAYNIEWKQFINEDGTVNKQMLNLFEKMGIKPDQKMIVYSRQGVRSGLVTHALYSMGLLNVANYSGGLFEYMNHYKGESKKKRFKSRKRRHR